MKADDVEDNDELIIRDAKNWHDDHIEELDHDYSSCWCCCITCDHTNPSYDAAQDAMRRQARRAP